MADVAQTAPDRRGALVVLVLVVALGCLALGWWQWERFSSASGNFQNLGYALQWPLFAGFAVYAYRRFVRLESGQEDEQRRPAAATELPTDLLPPRPAAGRSGNAASNNDPAEQTGLSEYNTYLAELASRDTRSDR